MRILGARVIRPFDRWKERADQRHVQRLAVMRLEDGVRAGRVDEIEDFRDMVIVEAGHGRIVHRTFYIEHQHQNAQCPMRNMI